MKPFQFITLRYFHDAITGEFANVGVVVYAPGEFLGARFNQRIGRLKCLFGEVEKDQLKSLLRHLDRRFAKLGNDIPGSPLETNDNLESVVRSVLPQDDSSLQWSSIKKGLTNHPRRELDRWFERLVTHYEKPQPKRHRNDQDVWNVFSAALKARAVLEHLEPKKLVAPDFDYTFEHAWKNGAWNLYEPVAFDYENADHIIDKGNRWLGRGVALKEASERHKFWFLVGEPELEKHKRAAEKAINLMCKIRRGGVEIVREHECDDFSEQLADDMKRHENT